MLWRCYVFFDEGRCSVACEESPMSAVQRARGSVAQLGLKLTGHLIVTLVDDALPPKAAAAWVLEDAKLWTHLLNDVAEFERRCSAEIPESQEP